MTTGCQRNERVAEYALHALPVDERSAFETHLQGCEECRRELESLRRVVDAFTDWPVDVLRPTTPWDRLARRIGVDPTTPLPASTWQEPAWKAVAPGISTKLLATDHAKGIVSMLVRLAPNTAYPGHTHASVEELHLLDGELWIEDRLLHPGDYSRAEPGTSDLRVFSETGCTCVLITSFRDVLG